MKAVIFSIIFIALVACSNNSDVQDIKLTSKKDSVSYSIGHDIGTNLKRQEIEINASALKAGMVDAMNDTTLLTNDEMMAVMTQFQKDINLKRQEKSKIEASKNQEEANKFFAENKTKAGIKTLDSGIQYKILKSGNGKSPKPTDKVKVHYTGRLLDGTLFDTSHNRGVPITTSVNGVIKGWTEILQLMKEGDNWEVYIPSNLAYGPSGMPPKIGPNAALVFEIELLSVE